MTTDVCLIRTLAVIFHKVKKIKIDFFHIFFFIIIQKRLKKKTTNVNSDVVNIETTRSG